MKQDKTHFTAVLALAMILLAPALHAAELNSSTTLEDVPTAPNAPRDDAPQFANVIDDLPLMPGLEIVPSDDVLFAVPRAGRIAETVTVGSVDIDDVYHFYRRSLPQLGWKVVDGRTYQRDQDLLRIDAHANGKVSTVRFSIKPADR